MSNKGISNFKDKFWIKKGKSKLKDNVKMN